MNPKEYIVYQTAHLEHEKAKFKQADMLNYLLGKYVAYAMNDPKKYPTEPFMSATPELPEMTDEEMERQARRNTIKLGGTIQTS